MFSAMWSLSSKPPPDVVARPKSADRLCERALAAFSRRNSCEKSVRMSLCLASVCALLSAPAQFRGVRVCVCVKYGARTRRKRKERGQGERPAATGSFTAPAGRLTVAAPRWEDRHVCGGWDGHAPLTVLPIAVFKSLSLLRSCSISPAIVVTFDEDAPGPPPLDMPPPPASFPAMCVNRQMQFRCRGASVLRFPSPPPFLPGSKRAWFPIDTVQGLGVTRWAALPPIVAGWPHEVQTYQNTALHTARRGRPARSRASAPPSSDLPSCAAS